jgi:CHAT domain-containing protein/Tfp pilus assembly protein PilF
MMRITSLPRSVSLPTHRSAAARSGLGVGLGAVLLLACACSRPPARPGAASASGASPPPDTAAAHLARGEEAREREDYELARREAEKARDLFEKDGDWEGYVRARSLLGGAISRLGDFEAAREELNATLATAREKLGPSHPEVARAYYEVGTVDVSTGRSREGLDSLEKALALRQAAGGGRTKEAAAILVRMGVAHTDLGEDERALSLFNEAEAIDRALPAQPRLSDALIGRGNALWGLARYDQARAALEQAVAILEAENPRRVASLAAAYSNLGNVYWSKSDYAEALAYYEKALPLFAAASDESHPRVGVGSVHFNLATLRFMTHDYDSSIASAERALKIFVPALGERSPMVVKTYNVLGSALTRKGETDRAIGVLEKAVAIQQSLPEKGDRDSAIVYSSLGEAHRARHDFSRADRLYREALAIDVSIYGRRHPDVAEDLVNLGELYLEEDEPAEALRYFDRAITANDPQLTRAHPDLDPPFETAFSEDFLLKALKGAARARRAAKPSGVQPLEAAALVYDHASRLVDRMRAGYRAEGSKLQVAESATEIHDEAIATELELHRLTNDERHLEKAFRFAEKSKVGILRDALNEAEARSFSGIPREVLDRERQLRIDLTAADQRLADAQLDRGAEEGRIQPLREKEFALKREYQALQQRLEKEYPAYYDLKYRFDTARPAEIQARLLDEGTVLVEYFLGRTQVFVFTITPRDVVAAIVAREASLDGDLSELRRAIEGRREFSSAASARRLYRQLLAPVEDRIAGRKLLIVPDGALSTVPFEALLAREAGTEATPGELPYVLRDHAVGYAYSATVALQEVRRRGAEPPEDFVGFAPLVSAATNRGASAALPASRKEVTEARALFARRRGVFADWFKARSRVYVGSAANEDRLKSPDLEHYRYVHLATHGIVDEDHPALSKLLLATQPGSAEDGALYLGESYGLHLNADLVVLSACDTGRGRLARGEGIIGFTRGFLYAGAKSLLVSLWPVSDAAASDLVVDFYRELLAGRPKDEALRQAKLWTMARNPEYAKPYYWASLVLVGERR